MTTLCERPTGNLSKWPVTSLIMSKVLEAVDRGFHQGLTSRSYFLGLLTNWYQVVNQERFLDYLLQIENLDTVTDCLRPNDSVMLIGFYFTPYDWNTMLWKTADIIEGTLFLAQDRDIVPPTLTNDFSKCCAVGLADNSKLTAFKSNPPNRATWKLRDILAA